MKFDEFCKQLEAKIQSTYESGVSLDEAEKLAAEFLYAQIVVAEKLKTADLDSRLRKSGLKAIRAAIYTDACSKADKKPTEAALDALVTLNEHVQHEQESFDAAEVERDRLERYFNIFKDAHIYYRGVSKGRFE